MKECNHKWKKIKSELFEVVEGNATHHCNKCGVLGRDLNLKKGGKRGR